MLNQKLFKVKKIILIINNEKNYADQSAITYLP